MKKLAVSLTFGCGDQNNTHKAEFGVEDAFELKRSDSLARAMLHECHTGLLYTSYRAALPEFRSFTEQMNWFPSTPVITDLDRHAAHINTAQTWWQIQNAFTEAAHSLARARAYDDISKAQTDENLSLYIHLMKIQCFDTAAYLICKVEDWFLLLLFVNSGGSLIPSVDVHTANWKKEISRREIGKGLRQRKSKGVRNSNAYLDAFSDAEYATIRRVFTRVCKPISVRTVRKYRNEVAHRGQPAVDVPSFSPAFTFPKKQGRMIQLGMPAGARVEYKFLDLYQHAVDALKHMETELLRLKPIPVLAPK